MVFAVSVSRATFATAAIDLVWAGAAGSGVVTAAPGHHRPVHRRGRGTVLAVATTAVAVAAGLAGGVFGSRLTSGTGTDPLARLSGPVAAGSVEQVAAVLLPSVVSVLSSSSAAPMRGPGSS